MSRTLPRSRKLIRRHSVRTGMAVIYVAFAMTACFAIISLTVDVGRVRVAKGQVQTAADAASMAAALTLPTIQLQSGTSTTYVDFGQVDQAAVDLAAKNKVTIDNVSVALQTADIEYGKWNTTTHVFTLTPRGTGNAGDPRQSANAIRVTAHRTTARGNPLPLTFAQMFGQTKSDLNAVSTALVEGAPSFTWGIVGIDSIDLSGNPSIDSYLPANGPYSSATKRYHGNVASNGDINGGIIYGDARPGLGHTFQGTATGYTAPLDRLLVFPPPVVPPGTPTLPAGSTVAAGTYQNVTAPSGKTFTGAVSIYITGSGKNAGLSLKGNTKLRGYNNNPANLKLYFVNPGTIDQRGTTDIYADIYAPTCSYSMNGTNGLFGALIAKSISIKGTPDIHFDESNSGVNNRSYTVMLVQ